MLATAGSGFFGQPVHLHDKDAGHRRPAVRDAQIQRREAERAAELLPVHHVPADGITVTEQAAGMFQVTGGQRLAHGGTGDAHAGLRHRAHLLDFEAELGTSGLEISEIAGALGAEAEIIAHQQPARVQAIHQNIAHELVGRLPGEMRVEMLHDHAVDALAAQAFQLVAQQGDAGGRAVRYEEFARMRLERHHRERQSACIGRRACAGQQRLVPAVHAVEVADGQRAGRATFGVGQAAKDFHEKRRWSRKGEVRSCAGLTWQPPKSSKTHII